MKCVICNGEVEAWPGGHGFGNNPDPWPRSPRGGDIPDEEFRCCKWCNENIVILMRLGMLTVESAKKKAKEREEFLSSLES